MESGWSMKQLHRVIVTSDTYRMDSRIVVDEANDGASDAATSDPENTLLWRMNVGRMEAEVVRDSLLHCAGRLDLRQGGQELENDQSMTTFRRSLYYSCHPELGGKSELGSLFDAAEATECYRRTRSIIPQQSLALTNSQLVHDLSQSLGEKLWRNLPADERSSPAAFVTAAFEQIISRPPTEGELRLGVSYMSPADDATQPAESPGRLRASFVRVLFNHNDFVAIR